MILAAALTSLFVLFSALEAESSFSFFVPPSGWEIAAPSQLRGNVEVGFFTKSKKNTPPSINFTIEHNISNFSEYLKSLQKLYSSSPKTSWKNLGAFSTRSGKGTLTTIEMQTPVEKMRILQLLLPKENSVFILTAASAKDEFSQNYPLFIQTLHSLTLADSVEHSLLNPEKLLVLQEELQSSSITSPEQFSEFLSKEFVEQGPYWQAKMLAHFLKLQENE